MIYDCITFFNELDLLDLRLNVLWDFVDYFVIAEGNKTHSGADKEFIFEKNKDRFKNYLDKIIYVKVDDFPPLNEDDNDNFGNNWLYENYQRDAIIRGLKDCKPDDIVIISDCDEIINPEILKSIDKYSNGIYSLKQFNIYYKYNSLDIVDMYSKKAKLCRYKDLIDPKQELKGIEYCKHSKYGLPTYLRFCEGKKIYNSGWHFSYIADTKSIINKRLSIVEKQYNTKENMDEIKIKEMIERGIDILGRDNKYVNIIPKGFLPQYIVQNIDKYSDFIGFNNQISFGKALLKNFLYKLVSIRHIGNSIHNQPYLKFFGLKIKLCKIKEKI